MQYMVQNTTIIIQPLEWRRNGPPIYTPPQVGGEEWTPNLLNK